MSIKHYCARFWPLVWLALVSPASIAIEAYQLIIEDHIFSPARLVIPSNQKVRLVINNHDNVPEEFDSFDLNREKVIFPNRKAVIFIGPLPPGEYHYFGEFHPDSARGVIVVKEQANAN